MKVGSRMLQDRTVIWLLKPVVFRLEQDMRPRMRGQEGNMSSIKAAIIGGGFAADLHAQALKSLGIGIAAVVTQHQSSAEKFARKWNIPVYGTDLKILNDLDIIAVHICTPPVTHYEYITRLLKQGVSVLCEKPLCLKPEEANEIIRLQKETDAICAVNFNVRYFEAIRIVKTRLAAGEFGRPLLISGNYMQEFDASPSEYSWRYSTKLGGPMRAVTEIGSHFLDTVQFVSGRKIQEVSATMANFTPDRILSNGNLYPASWGKKGQAVHISNEDAATVAFRCEDGVMGNVVLSEISHGRGNHLAFEIDCERGSLWWNEENCNVLFSAGVGRGIRTQLLAFGGGFTDTFRLLMEDFYSQVATRDSQPGATLLAEANGKQDTFTQQDVADADKKKRDQAADNSILPTAADGARMCRVCDAIYRSANNDSHWTEV